MCIDVCPVSSRNRQSGALVLPTKELSVSELWYLLYPQLDLVRNIGGLTVSGGEALLQSQVLNELLFLCKKEGIHIALETSGAISEQHITDVIEYVDTWLYGLRPTPFYTPTFANCIKDNLAFLSRKKRHIIIRMPVIAGITDLPESLDYIAGMMHANSLYEIQLLPYHKGTSHYYHALGKECTVGNEAISSIENLHAVREYFQRESFVVSIIQ